MEGALSDDRHWCDGQIYEIIMCLLVDVLPSKEACIEKITGFVREVDADVVESAVMEVEKEWASILGPFFNTVVYLSDVECSDSENEDQVVVVALKAKKEEFMNNAWEVFRVGVKNDDPDPFKQMMRIEEGWFSEGNIDRVAVIGTWVATILRLL